MRIAIDIRHLTHPQLSGIGLYSVHLIRALARLAPDDHFYLFASGTAKTLERLPPLSAPNITIVKKNIPNRLLFTALRTPFGPTLESFLPEPVDCWLFLDTNIIRTALQYALTVHDLTHDIFPHFFTAKDRWRNRVARVQTLTKKAQALLAVSCSTARDLETRWGVNKQRISLTPLGVAAQYTPHPAPSDKNYQRGYGLHTPYILSLATLEPRKNIESVVEAFDAFRATSPVPYKLAIGGGKGWKYADILQAVAKAKFKQDITLLGYVHEKHKPALYRGAKAFVFPSFYEGFGLPVLEAMACGTPVITSFTSSLPELVGEAALLVDPFNVGDITSALEQLFTAPGADRLRTLLSTRGVQRARQFTWDKTALATLDALHMLTNRPTIKSSS